MDEWELPLEETGDFGQSEESSAAGDAGCRDVERQRCACVMEIGIKQFERVVARSERTGSASARGIAMHAAKIANDAVIQINECGIVGADVEADRFLRWNVQDGGKHRRLKPVRIVRPGPVRRVETPVVVG